MWKVYLLVIVGRIHIRSCGMYIHCCGKDIHHCGKSSLSNSHHAQAATRYLSFEGISRKCVVCVSHVTVNEGCLLVFICNRRWWRLFGGTFFTFFYLEFFGLLLRVYFFNAWYYFKYKSYGKGLV